MVRRGIQKTNLEGRVDIPSVDDSSKAEADRAVAMDRMVTIAALERRAKLASTNEQMKQLL